MFKEAYQDGFNDGYQVGCTNTQKNIVAFLKSGRTPGGETITSAKHAAEIIERGDANGYSKKETPCQD